MSEEVPAARWRAAQALECLTLDGADDVAIVVRELLVRQDVARGEERDAVHAARVLDEDRLRGRPSRR